MFSKMQKTYSRLKVVMSALLMCILLASCGEYQAILKTSNPDLWYRKGLEYYERGDYNKAANLLGGVLAKYASSSRYDTIVTTYADALVKLGDFYSAAHYYSDYVRTYPSSSKCEDCQYMVGYCYYKLSPRIELDQSDTEKAVEELNLFLNLYPESEKAHWAVRMLKDMEDKLAEKGYVSAKLYFDLGNYMGNNYQSAVITAQNCLRKYPDTVHREELSYLILESKYIQADRSVLQKQADRYRDAIDEYYSFINEFPDSKYRRKADDMFADSEKGLARVEKLIPPSEDDLDYYKNFGKRMDEQRSQKSDLSDK